MVLLPLPLVIVANSAVGKSWANTATSILGGLIAGLICLLGALDLAGAPILANGLDPVASVYVDVGTIVTGFAAAAIVSKPVRERLALILPIDSNNPVHALALVLAVILFGTQLTTIAFTDVLGADQSQAPLTLGDIVIQEAPFLILGFAGVGIFSRRSASAALGRLGLSVPSWWQVAIGLAAAGLFIGFAQEMDALSHSWTPQVAHQVDATTQHLFGGLGGPVGVAVVALAPGICEEILFRGALQPRIGLVATALLFTSIHTQYGLSLDALSVFMIALGLGVIRKYTNTTTSGLCHVTYNLVTGVNLAGAVLGIAAVVEVALIGLSVYGFWSSRRRPSVTTAGVS